MPIPIATSTATTAKRKSARVAQQPPIGWRVAAGLLGGAALALSALAGTACLSSLYASVARDVVRHSQGRHDGLDAAWMAARLAPWRAAQQTVLAQSLSARGKIDAAIEHAEHAIKAAPADGYAWAYLGRLVGAASRSDRDLAGIYAMALRQSPNAPPLHWAIALDGVRRWRMGDDELHSLWRRSMAYSLHHNRRAFLSQVVHLGRDPYWCAANQNELPIAKWCAQARITRQNCSAPGLSSKAASWCKNVGITPPRP